MQTADTTPELFPAPDWRRRWVRVNNPPAGTLLRVVTDKGHVVEGTLLTHEHVRAGHLVTIDTGRSLETFVLPQLEVTIPLPLEESDQISA